MEMFSGRLGRWFYMLWIEIWVEDMDFRVFSLKVVIEVMGVGKSIKNKYVE